jgi:small GTP-binding protein
VANRHYYSSEEEEEQEKLKKKVTESVFRKSDRPTTIRELGATALKNLPANLGMVQGLMSAVNWNKAQQEVLEGLNNSVVIVGQPNTGKSTLFNKIKGQTLSPTSSEAGTTRDLVRTDFGPFTLIDTPGHLPDIMESGMDQASVIVFLIDASRGFQEEDRQLYTQIKGIKKPTIIAVNKVDTLKGGESGDQLATEIAVLLDFPGVIPISARTGENVLEELIPAIIQASPEAALAIGRELPKYRREAAQRIIRNAALVSLAAGVEPIPLIDIPILLGTQVRLVLRLAALYGEPLDSVNAMKNVRELLTTMVSGLGLRYLAQQAAKWVPFGGDFVAGTIAGAATWSIGQVALEYYEGGKAVNTQRLQQLYQRFYQRLRRGSRQELLNEDLKGNGTVALLGEPKEKPEAAREKVLEEGTA